MPISEARKRANRKWTKAQRQISITVKPGLYSQLQNYATAAGLSLRGFLLTAANEYILAHPISPDEDEQTCMNTQ